jgi:cobalt-zinc-cadmium resistance protein CzcA
LASNNEPLKILSATTLFFSNSLWSTEKVNETEYKKKSQLEIQKKQTIVRNFKVYYHIVYLQNREKLYFYLDSLYQNFSKASDRRFELGETNYLEK